MPSLADCPCTGGTLDRLIQPAILIVLAEGPLHGYRVAQRLGEMPNFASQSPDVSGVYRALKAMESKQLVVGTWDVSQGGPARKRYEIAPAGRECLGEWIKTLEEYRRDISSLLRMARRVSDS